MRFYNEPKSPFPILNKKAYYEANKSHLGVKLRRFQQWFHSEAIDKAAIKAKTKPKPEVVRKQNKVEFQGDRTRYTPQNKLGLIRQYDKQKTVNPGLTQKEFCSTRASLKAGTFGKWLPVMERKRIQIEVRHPELQRSRWSSNGTQECF